LKASTNKIKELSTRQRTVVENTLENDLVSLYKKVIFDPYCYKDPKTSNLALKPSTLSVNFVYTTEPKIINGFEHSSRTCKQKKTHLKLPTYSHIKFYDEEDEKRRNVNGTKSSHSFPPSSSIPLKQKELLTAKEEKRLGRLVQHLLKIRSLEQSIFKISGRYPTPTEVASLLRMKYLTFIDYRNACNKARQYMIDRNLRLVISVAKKSHSKKSGIDLHDLVTVGVDGLARAVEKFDPSKGYKFSTYAHWWIRQAVDRYILERRPVKVPVHLWEILSKIRKAQRALRLKLNREPSYGEVGTLLGLDRDRVEHIVLAYQDTESLDEYFTDSTSNSGPLEEIIVVESFDKDREENTQAFPLPDTRLQKMIETLLDVTLTEREAEILRMRYGLDDGIPKTLDEIGGRFQVTRERVRQIETKVSRKLKSSKQRELLQKDLASQINVVMTKGLYVR